MGSKKKASTDKWHYLDVNRGRYLCLKHGGFCDSSDNYTTKCPICNKGDKKNWQINPVDVSLQIVRNLQNRSMKRFYIIYGVTGFLGLFSITQTVTQENKLFDYLSKLGGVPFGFLVLFGISFILSFVCYLFSMGHVKTTKKEKPHEFLEETIDDWKKYMAEKIKEFEWYHTTGNLLLALSGLCLIIFLIIQLF